MINESKDHPTAETIYERCKLVEPSISMGTVYRNLGVLAELGEVLHLPMPKGPDHYDFNIKPHCHFFCRRCNCVTDVDEPDVWKSIDKKVKIPGYKLEGYQLIMIGICPDCLKKEIR